MAHRRRTSYQAYIGNVTRRSRLGDHHDACLWMKGKNYTEKRIADMLQEAYNQGRQEALEEISDAITEAAIPRTHG